MTEIRTVLQRVAPRKHSTYTHFQKDRNCEVCLRTKITRALCRQRNGEAVPRSHKFGDSITADHKVLSEEGGSRNNHRYSVVVQEWTTQWIQSYPCFNENFSGGPKEFTKSFSSRRKSRKLFFRQFIGIWQIL